MQVTMGAQCSYLHHSILVLTWLKRYLNKLILEVVSNLICNERPPILRRSVLDPQELDVVHVQLVHQRRVRLGRD